MSQTRTELRLSRGLMTDPKSLAEYEAACPGAAQIIIDNYVATTQDETKHRREMERLDQAHRMEMDKLTLSAETTHITAITNQGTRAQWMGLTIVLGTIGAGATTALAVNPIVGAAIIATGLGSAAVSFIFGRRHASESPTPAKQEPPREAPRVSAPSRPPELPSVPPPSDPPTKR